MKLSAACEDVDWIALYYMDVVCIFLHRYNFLLVSEWLAMESYDLPPTIFSISIEHGLFRIISQRD